MLFSRKQTVFQRPIQCPQGHHTIYWFYKEDEVLCDLCDQTYRISECFSVANGPSCSPKVRKESADPKHPFRLKIIAGSKKNEKDNGAVVEQEISKNPRELYRDAFLAYQNQGYEKALRLFKDFQEDFPSHSLSPNVQYAIGFCYIRLNMSSAALVAFNRLCKYYPQSSKVPNAMLMIAMIRKNRGEVTECRSLLTEIIRRHSDSEVAEKAQRVLVRVNSDIDSIK